jgi:hypothetical protein
MYQVEAKVKFIKRDDDFLEAGVKSGYCPHHKFSHWDYLLSGRHDYGDSLRHFPEEELTVKIGFPSWDEMEQHIQVGDEFTVQELNTVVGKGSVVKIL